MNGSKWFLLIIIGAALILGTASLALAQDDNAVIFERYIDALWNKGKFFLLGSVVNRDVVQHDSSLPEPVTGSAALVDYIQQRRSDLPDIEFTVGSVTTEGDLVTADLTAMIKDVQVPLQAKARIADGKLVETWFDVNALVSNPDIEAAVAQVEADNLALGQKLVEFMQNMEEYTSDLKRFNEIYLSMFPSSYFYHGVGGGEHGTYITPAGDYAGFREWAKSYSDWEWTAENIVVQGGMVYIHYTQSVTFSDPLNWPGLIPLEPTGKKVVEQGMFIHRVEHGKFVEQWWYVDSPVLWVEMALMFERGRGGSVNESVAQEIYNQNNPK